MKHYRVDGTPSLVVNGHYRVNMQAVESESDLIALLNWLVAKEAG